ncbi:EF-P beta-lysylation protein EpmB [Psychromonas sp. 14N.309.X.WAT.B.A12]|uniref:EF-P beta-lysylation protein EpmB n=1 Tax=Psychromonas sp. 14N.309.X.WAT.B.A12 TaxID=2998322 RepID=UPI0025B040DC|nr:EF-P beta-lysylation protein EpmB [Psychromonas sp. 14N.309.X.WAT.B.A12]MDN2662742.1 EF-P beta-lysylation protein EpmB [Psychromonas sp. 14N.309.X.WAT.B.A12]
MLKIIDVNNTADLPTWQKELANAVKNPQQLLQILEIEQETTRISELAKKQFPMLVPMPFVNKMKKGDINDPLLKQVLPIHDEELHISGYSTDPLVEQNNQHKGLLHKYKSRVLIILKSGCAVNCRYCFRRHFPYADNSVNKSQLTNIVSYIQAHPQVNEVILSGGDPLMTKDKQLAELLDQLEALPQLTRLRIHTRLPVVIPSRITDTLTTRLQQSRLKIVMVLHINHAQEIDKPFAEAMQRCHQAGIQLLNQSVLLKDVNDDVTTLVALSEALFSVNILPYYLFLLDKVQGAAHFDLNEQKAQQLHKQMQAELPGYLVPRLSREIAGEQSKTLIHSL